MPSSGPGRRLILAGAAPLPRRIVYDARRRIAIATRHGRFPHWPSADLPADASGGASLTIERRNPRPRSTRAFVKGPAPTFNPTPQGWAEIETPYKCKHRFSEEERERIQTIVNEYFYLRRFEQAAALRSDIITIIKDKLQAVHSVNISLTRLMGSDEPKEARLDAVLAIEREWPGGSGELNLAKSITQNHALELACKKAIKKAMKPTKDDSEETTKDDSDPGIKIGSAWDAMIIELIYFLRGIGLEVSANKGQRGEEKFNVQSSNTRWLCY